MRVLKRLMYPTSKIYRVGSRPFSKTTGVYASASKSCQTKRQKGGRTQLEAKRNCRSLLECGPCSKFKYMDLSCKIALITGGASGIGFAIANEVLCQDAHKVLIAHPDIESGIKAVEALENVYGKDKACFVNLNFQKSGDFEGIFKTIHNKFGGIDILVNCTWPLDDYRWDYDVDANLKNIMRGTLVAMEWMPKERKSMKGGIVVNVAATCGLESESMAPIWTATKHGVVGLSKALGYHEHFLNNGVRVVCLCPGKDYPIEPLELTLPEQLKQYSQGIVRQPACKVGSAVTYLVRYAPSGSVWVVEKSALYKTKIPNRKKYSKIVDLL